jgi:hypothetical protein
MYSMMLAVLSAVVASSVLAASTDQAWRDWQRLSHGQCPTHHVEWVCGDCYLFLVEGFDATLTSAQQRNARRVADIARSCAKEQFGFGCEAGRSFLAYEELGLMPRFVHYGCRVIKCEEAAVCSRAPTE